MFKNRVKSIAIGSFDGIHIAHKRLIDQVEAVVIIERNGGYLTPGFKRSLFVSKVCVFYHFDVIKGLTPEAFVQKLQEDFPQLERIVVGYDFHFGREKRGDTAVLCRLFPHEVEVVDEVMVEGISVHSRTIKAYLKEGKVEVANRLLGREYLIEGEVISGQGLGQKKLFPTLNVEVQRYQLPKEGVYTTRTSLDGVWFDSVSFIGHRVTTDGRFAVESYVLDRDLGVIEGSIKLRFVGFIRENRKFESLEALKGQIAEDIIEAKEVLVCQV